MKRLILFLIRLKLGVKKNERFRFTNQTNKDECYYIDSFGVIKISVNRTKLSNVSLNWLLNRYCEIEKVEVKK